MKSEGEGSGAGPSDRPTRRHLLRLALTCAGLSSEARLIPGEPVEPPLWSVRFLQVKGLLEVRLGGPNGELIKWTDRGNKGRYTWTAADSAPETRPIDEWVRGRNRFSLHAKIFRDETAEHASDPFCEMGVLRGGELTTTMRFQDEAQEEFAAE